MSDLMEHEPAAALVWDGLCPGCGEIGEAARGVMRCVDCGTLWVAARRDYQYDDSCPTLRGHDDAAIAACKIRTFEHWCRRLDTGLVGQRVLEVGFGGGPTLAWMRDQGAQVSGVEPVAANRAMAIRAGIPEANVRPRLADFEGSQFDLVFYLDSFEHETEPAAHLATLDRLTRPGSRAMLVLPVADSLSRRVLGRWWPHDIQDHWVFWSTAGLVRLWNDHGWQLTSTFHPSKYLSASTITRHWELKTRIPLPPVPRRAAVWLNFGERGLIFEKC
jgi:SAM-dependent methyltransferase